VKGHFFPWEKREKSAPGRGPGGDGEEARAGMAHERRERQRITRKPLKRAEQYGSRDMDIEPLFFMKYARLCKPFSCINKMAEWV